MARKYLVADKRGVVMHRKLSKKSLSNYKPVFEAKDKGRWKPVYEKRFAVDRPKLYSRKFKNRQFKAEREKAVTGTPERASLVEVKGLVSGEYKLKSHPFHCEMLFYWCGNEGFDEKKLLESAYEVMIESLPEIDRITYMLITSEHFGPDYQRWGIESINPVQSGILEQMEFEIFVPGAKSGRVLYNNSAWVKA
jgi:hypothetical protein